MKITENLHVRAVSQKKEHKKRQKVQKEKDEIGENRERIGPKITENNGKSASLIRCSNSPGDGIFLGRVIPVT